MTKARVNGTTSNAKGDLVVGTGSTTAAALSVGTDGYLLYADSTQTPGVKWAAAPAAGSLTQIATGTFSGATTTISSISQSYKSLYLTFTGVTNSDNSGYSMYLRYNSETASTYRWSLVYNGSLYSDGGTATTGIKVGLEGFSPDTTISGTITMPLYSVSGIKKISTFNYVDSSGYNGLGSGSTSAVTAAITSINFITSFTFTGGTYILYGVN